jgi:Lon-like ATP-dependent protease
MTGSLSVRGDVLPVGGVTHKVEAAAKAGLRTVVVPAANAADVLVEAEYGERVTVVPVRHISEVLEVALADADTKQSVLDRLARYAHAPGGRDRGRDRRSGPTPAP